MKCDKAKNKNWCFYCTYIVCNGNDDDDDDEKEEADRESDIEEESRNKCVMGLNEFFAFT